MQIGVLVLTRAVIQRWGQVGDQGLISAGQAFIVQDASKGDVIVHLGHLDSGKLHVNDRSLLLWTINVKRL